MKCKLNVFTHLMIFLFFIVGCSSSIDTSSLFSSPPEAASSLAVSPVSPGNNKTPTVTGTAAISVTVKLYTNSNCKGSVVATGISNTSGAFNLTSSILEEGTYHFSVQSISSSGVTSCSTTSVNYDLDLTPPTIQFTLPSISIVNSASPAVQYFLTYIGATTVNLTSASISLNKTGSANCSVLSVANGTTLIPKVSISGCTGAGTIGISIAAGTGADNVGNLTLASNPSSVFIVDNFGITTAAFNPPTGTYDAPPATVTVTFGETLLGTSVTASDFSVTGTCSARPSVSLISAIGSAATLHLAGGVCSAGQTTILTAHFAGVQDAAGNFGSGSSSATYTIDNVGPTSATFNPTSARFSTIPASLIVTFNEAVAAASLSSSDFVVSGTCSVLPSVSIHSVSGTSAQINLSSATCSLNQTVSVRINLPGITDLLGNPGVGFRSETYTYDNLGPATVSISPLTASYTSIPTTVNINFNEALLATSVTASDLLVSGTCSTLPTVSLSSVSGAQATFSLTGAVCSVGQTVNVTLNGPSVTDAARNVGSGSVNAIYTFDNQGPIVSSTSPLTGTMNTIPTSVTVFFDKPILPSSINSSDLLISGTCSTLPTASLLSLSGSTAVYTLSGAICANAEDVEITFDGTRVTDAAANIGSGLITTIYTIDIVGPTPLVISPNTAHLKIMPTTISVTFDKSILALSVVGADLSISGSCSSLPTASVASVIGSVVNFNLTGGSCLDNQTLIISALGANVTDLSGNAGSNNQITTYTKDSTGPVVSSISPATRSLVSLPTFVNFTFNESLLASSVTLSDFSMTGTCNTLPIASVLSVSGQQVLISFSGGNCTDSQSATLSLNNMGISDVAENNGIGTTAVAYTIDQSGPSLVSVSPHNGPPPSVVVLNFNENLDLSSISAGDFSLGGSCAAQSLNLTNVINNTVELSLSGDPCNSGESVEITINSANVKDQLGNAGLGSSVMIYTEP